MYSLTCISSPSRWRHGPQRLWRFICRSYWSRQWALQEVEERIRDGRSILIECTWRGCLFSLPNLKNWIDPENAKGGFWTPRNPTIWYAWGVLCLTCIHIYTYIFLCLCWRRVKHHQIDTELSPSDFRKHYRMDRQSFEYILGRIRRKLQKKSSMARNAGRTDAAMTPEQMLGSLLKHLGGSTQHDMHQAITITDFTARPYRNHCTERWESSSRSSR